MNNTIGKELKKAFQKSYIFLIFFVTGIIIGYEYHQSFIVNPSIKEWQIEKFQKTFIDKEKEIAKKIDDIKFILSGDTLDQEIRKKILDYNQRINDKEFSFYIYRNDTIVFWSTNKSTIPITYSSFFAKNEKSVELGNAYYYSISRKLKDYIIVGLFKVKNNYIIENELLKNNYNKDFNLSESASLSINHCLNCSGIYNTKGDRVFSIEFGIVKSEDLKTYESIYLYIILFVLLSFILFGLVFTRSFKNTSVKNTASFSFIIILIVIRIWLMFRLKKEFSGVDIFSPSLFAASEFLSSLGDLILHALFLFIIVLVYYENFTLKKTLSKIPSFFSYLKFYGYLIVIYTLIIWFNLVFESLIRNSDISFEIYKVLDMDVYTFIALSSVLLIYISICVLFDKVLLHYINTFPKNELTKHLLISIVFLTIIGSFILNTPVSIVYFSFTLSLLFIFRTSKENKFTFLKLIVITLFFSIFSVYFIITRVSQKQYQNKKVLAVNLASEHDYITEMLLENISIKLHTDKRLISYLTEEVQYTDEMNTYIRNKYFSGYLGKYDIQIILCNPNDSIYITSDNEYSHCYNFFKDYVSINAINVPNTEFYFVNDVNGRIGYLGTIIFDNPNLSTEYTLYIELISKLVSTELGYPELLLGRNQKRSSSLKDYSYAKYNNSDLISKTGEFQYALKKSFNKVSDFQVEKQDGFNHLLFFPDDENVIIISNPGLKTADVLFTFSYLFLFYLICIGLMSVLYRPGILENLVSLSFRNKIQFSMLMVLIISLILIGGLTIFFSIEQYKNKHLETISEKLQSVQIELKHKLEFEEELTNSWSTKGYDNLDGLLGKFSVVFYSDIHLYDPQGYILASSRPEIFLNQLQGTKIDPFAYFQLTVYNKGEFIHNEQIGTLSYLSGYIPFFNNSGKLLAYLNLPYFTRQNIFTKEITNLVIAVINIYVLLFLITTAFAFFMSEQITRPLKLIQDSFKKVKLGKKNQPIHYKGNDEIAALINEYNRMVVELSESAEKLARSERAMAWREMARQIAHEIKNPLTPMKLNIQQLQRAWNDKAPNWDEMFNKFSVTMIEQINTLSSIATEFSNFAKMPQPKNEVVNIVDKIKNIVRLFEHTENMEFKLDFNSHEEINIYADKEQILRVFTNLVKNAIQSIPDNKKGIIKIETNLNEERDRVKVNITDNGNGIPEDIHNRLFQPNFTTKSSGMGLGLAIVKKIIDTTNGTITFETSQGVGTCFSIEWELFR